MKFRSLLASSALLLLLNSQLESASAIRVQKKIKLGDEWVDFDDDDEDEKKARIEQISLDELNKADSEMLKDFEQILSSAQRNAEKGDLNKEMA